MLFHLNRPVATSDQNPEIGNNLPSAVRSNRPSWVMQPRNLSIFAMPVFSRGNDPLTKRDHRPAAPLQLHEDHEGNLRICSMERGATKSTPMGCLGWKSGHTMSRFPRRSSDSPFSGEGPSFQSRRRCAAVQGCSRGRAAQSRGPRELTVALQDPDILQHGFQPFCSFPEAG